VKYRVDAATLPSGIRVLAYQFAGARTFSIDASYQVGGIDDPPGKEGLTALVARLVGRRAGRVGERPSFSGRLFVAGLVYDGRAGMDAVDFWTRGPPDRLATALEVEADRLRDPLAGLGREDFLRERDGLIREILDAHDPIAQETELQWLVQAALPPGPYRRPLTGSPESLRSIAFEDLQAFCHEHFTPDRLLLVLIGPEPAPEMVKRVADTFSFLSQSAGATRPPRARVAQQLDFASPQAPVVRRGPVEGVHLWLGWAVPGDGSADRDLGGAAAAARKVVLEAMSGVSGEVSVMVRRQDGYALVAVLVGLAEEKDAEKVVDTLQRAKLPSKVSLVTAGFYDHRLQELSGGLDLERPNAELVARFARSTSEPDAVQAMQSWTPRSLDGFRRYLDRWLQPSRAVALMILPETGRSEPSMGVPEGAEALLSSVLPGEPRLPPGKYDVLAIVRPPHLNAALRERLPNGLRVVILHRTGFPLVHVRLVVKTGPEGTAEVPVGLPALALTVAQRGWTFAGTSWCDRAEAYFHRDHVRFATGGPPDSLARQLERLACWTERLVVEDRSLDWRRKIASRALEVRGAKPAFAAVRALVERLYPGTAGQGGDRMETQASASSDQLEGWLAGALRPDRATLIIAGDVDVGPELMDTIRRLFGSWKVRRDVPEAPARIPRPPRAGPILVAPWPGARSAALLLAAKLSPPAARDDAAFDAMLKGLRRQLERDRGGGSLGQTILGQTTTPYGPLLFACLSAPTERTAPALRHLLGTLDGTALAPPARELSELLRWDLAREQPFRLETVRQVADALALIAARDERPDFWESLPASIASLSPERIFAEARPLASRAALVVGDAEAIVPQLRKAGFAVEVLPEPKPRKPRSAEAPRQDR